MADAFAMVERCFEQQWRGLCCDEEEWTKMISDTCRGPGFNACYPDEIIAAMNTIPLWSTDVLCLMSVKVD